MKLSLRFTILPTDVHDMIYTQTCVNFYYLVHLKALLIFYNLVNVCEQLGYVTSYRFICFTLGRILLEF